MSTLQRLVLLALVLLALATPVRAQFQPWIQEDPAQQPGRLVTPPPGGFFPRQQPNRVEEFRQKMDQRFPEPVRCTQTCARDASGRVTCQMTCR